MPRKSQGKGIRREGGATVLLSGAFQTALSGVQLAKETVRSALDLGVDVRTAQDRKERKQAQNTFELLSAMEMALQQYQEVVETLHPDRHGFMVRNIGPQILELMKGIETAAMQWETGALLELTEGEGEGENGEPTH